MRELGDDRPVVQWATKVVYGADHGSQMAGETVWISAESRERAEYRRAWHAGNGATLAVVRRRRWVPTEWETVK